MIPRRHATLPQDRVSRIVSMRIGMMAIALALTWAAMRHLRQPETAEKIGRIFPASNASRQLDRTRQQLANAPSGSQPWETVQDNAPFAAAEAPAWLELLRRAQQTSQGDLQIAPIDEVAYAQLRRQPDAYRGKAVRVRGKALRVTIERPMKNELSIEEYFRLIIAPRGGGEFPFVVYSLSLPEEFPLGEQVKADVVVDGFFFKCWSYAHADGLGIAPIVIAAQVDWLRQKVPSLAMAPAGKTRDGSAFATRIALATGVAGLAAGLAIAWAARRTRRKTSSGQYGPLDVAALTERDRLDAEGSWPFRVPSAGETSGVAREESP